MTHDKHGTKIYSGEMVQYQKKLWTFESQMGGHINLRNAAGDLISVKARDVEGYRSLNTKKAEPQAHVGPTTTENAEPLDDGGNPGGGIE